jgi:hypothetical protein
MIYGLVVLCILIYKMWDAIQDGPARTTPGKAVGFLFIPFFNFYWIFQAYWGWTKDYNAYGAQKGLGLPRMPEGLALALCILAIVGIIPMVGYITGLISLVLMIVFLNTAINGVNALYEAEVTGEAGVGAAPAGPGEPPPAPPMP